MDVHNLAPIPGPHSQLQAGKPSLVIFFPHGVEVDLTLMTSLMSTSEFFFSCPYWQKNLNHPPSFSPGKEHTFFGTEEL